MVVWNWRLSSSMTRCGLAVDGVDFVAGYLLVELGEGQVVAFEEAREVVFEVRSGWRPAPALAVMCAALDIG